MAEYDGSVHYLTSSIEIDARSSNSLCSLIRTQSQKLARSAAVTGRTIFVGGAQRRGAASAPTPAIAFDMLTKVVVRRQGLKRKFNEQRRHERPGLKRKRLVMTRWRKRFREGFNAAVTRVDAKTV